MFRKVSRGEFWGAGNISFFFFKILFILLLDRGERRERKGEKHHYVVASYMPFTGHLAYNPGMCLDWESNQ